MDNLRIVARQEGRTGQGKRAVLFNELFLRSVRRNGRVFETGVVAAFNLKIGKPLHDTELARFMLKGRKLRFVPVRIRKTAEMAGLFAKRKKG